MARIALKDLIWITDHCIRRGTYPGRIDSPVATFVGGDEPPTYFPDITRAVESLFLPHVHRKAEAPGQRLACLLCGAHPENHYFVNCTPGDGAPSFRPARWPDGRHDGPPANNPRAPWPGQHEPPIEPARAPAICLLCVERDWKQDEDRVRGAVVALQKSPQYLDTEEGALDIQDQLPLAVIRVVSEARCSCCHALATGVIQGRSAAICGPCFRAIKVSTRDLFHRLDTEARLKGPWED